MDLVCQHECNEKAQKRNSVNASQATMEQPSRTIVHAKLEMTNPDSQEELEADAAANDIVQGGKIARSILAGSSDGGMAVSSQMECRLNSLQGCGQVMPDGLRNMMERGFNRDFSQVRLHTDSEAASLSSSIHAKAFTHGNDIYFNQGQFSPNTSEGQKLMAHELTHVVQGGGKVARDEEKDSAWNDFYNHYPSTVKFSSVAERNIYYIFLYSVKNDNESYKKYSNKIEDDELRKKVDIFVNKYKGQLTKLAPHISPRILNPYILNIARSFLLYGPDFYIKKKRNLANYVNACAMRVSIALGRSGITIKNLATSFRANGFEYFGAEKKFGVTDGPKNFKKALDKQFKKNGKDIITIKLTITDFESFGLEQQLKKDKKKLEADRKKLETDRKKLQKKVDSFKKKKKEEKILEHQGNIKKLQEEIKKLQEEIDNNPDKKSKEYKRNDRNLKDMEKKLNDKTKELDRLNNEKNELKNRGDELNNRETELNNRDTELNNRETEINGKKPVEIDNAIKKLEDNFKHRGIIVMITNLWSDAGGHVTLWNWNKEEQKGEAADSLDVRYPNKKNAYQEYNLYKFDDIEFEKIK